MKKYIPLIIGLLAVVMLLIFAVGQGRAQQAGPISDRPEAPEANPYKSDFIPVQGRLTDASGNPLNGNYPLTFRIYDVETGGTALCEDSRTVNVKNGLFSSYMLASGCAIDGRQLYFGIQVSTDPEMTPRSFIDNVPYAWGLRPGAVISASLGSNAIFHVETWSETGRGVRSYAMSTTGANYGMVGASRSSDGYGGYFYNNGGGTGLFGEAISDTAGIGVMGESVVGAGLYGKSASGFGVYGTSTSSNALYGDTLATSHNYGVYTGDNLYSLNVHISGAVMQVVKNGGSSTLEAGDVVVFSGVLAPKDSNEPPVILVAKATAANSTAVAGVVYSRYSLEQAALEGAVQPDEYLLIVIQGPARVKVSAAASPIQTGDLLSTSGQAGLAARAAIASIQEIPTAIPGTVFAKALETLDSGEGWMYVFVTLQ
jgi:hypothetical protein